MDQETPGRPLDRARKITKASEIGIYCQSECINKLQTQLFLFQLSGGFFDVSW